MAKGISAVIATIMLLLITIALIGVFYTFSTTIVETKITAGTEQAAATTEMMLKQITVSAATCKNSTTYNVQLINFTVQNIGIRNITAGELKVFVDDVENAQTEELIAGLAANTQTQVGVQTTSYSKTRTLKIQGPSNNPIVPMTC